MARRSKYQGKLSDRKSLSGQTLLEALMGLSVLAVVLVCLSQLSNSASNTAKVKRLNTTRNQLISDLVKLASTPAALRASAGMGSQGGNPANQMLASCLNDAASSCDSTMQYDFVLYGPSTNTGVAPGVLTGTSAQPLRYRGDGIPCTVTNCPASEYPLQIYTQFRAVCAPPGPTAPGQLMINTLAPPLTCSASNLDLVLVTISLQPTPGSTPLVAPYETTVPVKARVIPDFNWR